MKRTAILISALAICFLFTDCGKYPEGPNFSLRTKRHRLENVWKVDKYIVNGTDSTIGYRDLVTSETMDISKKGKFIYDPISTWVWAGQKRQGTWLFMEKKECIVLLDDSTDTFEEYEILKLKEDELWWADEEDGFKREYHFIPK